MLTAITVLISLTSVILIMLILLQRGRGGGLAGALGGMGGQSAFGSKAGDVFTRITSGVAIVWIVLCVGALKLAGTPSTDKFGNSSTGTTPAGQESVEPQTKKQKSSPAGSSGAKSSPTGGTDGAKK